MDDLHPSIAPIFALPILAAALPAAGLPPAVIAVSMALASALWLAEAVIRRRRAPSRRAEGELPMATFDTLEQDFRILEADVQDREQRRRAQRQRERGVWKHRSAATWKSPDFTLGAPVRRTSKAWGWKFGSKVNGS